MDNGNASRPTMLGLVLRDCLLRESITAQQFAGRLLDQGFPLPQDSNRDTGSMEELTWLTRTIEDLFQAPLSASWPFAPMEFNEFVDYAVRCLPNVFQA